MDAMGPNAAALNSRTEAETAPAARGQTDVRRNREALSSSLRRAILTQIVELDVVPQLLRALVPNSPAPNPAAPVLVTPSDVAELTSLSLGDSVSAVSGFVAGLHRRGISPESLYLDLMTPVAQRLGQFWDDDEVDFTEVTIGVWRLHDAMRELSPAFLGALRPRWDATNDAPRALLVPLPGEQHTFGVAMVCEFFRRARWNAWSGPVETSDDLAAMVRDESVDVLGFSLASDEQLDTARIEIEAVRRESRNPHLVVMAGGPPFVGRPDLAASIGADGTAQDGLQAVEAAEALLRRAKGRS